MDKIIKIKNDANDEIFSMLGFITEDIQTIDKLKQVNYDYIKYDGVKVVKDDSGKQLDVYIIKFTDMPNSLLNAVKESISLLLDTSKNKSCYNALETIISYFQKTKYVEDIENNIATDIGEILFMLKAKEFNINLDKYALLNEFNEIYFQNENTMISLTSESKSFNTLLVDYKEKSENTNNVIYGISTFIIEEKKEDILSLYKKLDSKNPIIINKYEDYKWLFSKEEHKKLLDKYTVDMNTVECFILEDSVIPTIDIKSPGGMTELKCKIKFDGSHKLELSALKDFVDTKTYENN